MGSALSVGLPQAEQSLQAKDTNCSPLLGAGVTLGLVLGSQESKLLIPAWWARAWHVRRGC